MSKSESNSEESYFVQKIGELQSVRASSRFNGKNYLKWSQIIRTYIKGRGRLNHLLGIGPEKTDPTFEAWDAEDSMIMSWLWDSMEPTISDTCMFLNSAKEIWDYISRTYSKTHDAAFVYEIKEKAGATKQGDKSVTEYATLLQNLWQELDHYRMIEMKCLDDAVTLKKFIEDRIYDFLAGLRPEYDPVRLQILSKEDTPSLEETISLIRAEESRRGVMLNSHTTDGSALTAKTNQETKNSTPNPSGRDSQGKDNLWCTYCKKPRHTKEKCWKLNGKPPSREWSNRGALQRSQAHMTEQPSTEEKPRGEFDGGEIAQLRNLLGSLEKPSRACSMAMSGKTICLNASYTNSWIIDSGATNHMPPHPNCFIPILHVQVLEKLLLPMDLRPLLLESETYISHQTLFLKMFFMYPNYPQALYLSKN